MTVAETLDWVLSCDGLPLVYSSADPAEVRGAQGRSGLAASAAAIEDFFASLAVEAQTRRDTSDIGGGETSGAVVNALEADALRIGPMIDPGVPAVTVEGQPLALALKSGNFGADDFFLKAARVVEGG